MSVQFHVRRPPCLDAVLGGQSAIIFFRRRGDADAMDEVRGYDVFSHRLSTDETRMKNEINSKGVAANRSGR